MIYTFYSYKGGVGRSMALANVAEWLYLQGLRVVIIDWDLEAPGLESFFYRSADELELVRSQLGLIDMLMAYKRTFPRLSFNNEKAGQKKGDNQGLNIEAIIAELQQKLPSVADSLYPIHAPACTNGNHAPALWLLPAGWRAGDRFPVYAQAVQGFDWADFYASYYGEAYFEWLRTQLVDEDLADVVLIDSRTGVTEMGGVCTRQMADVGRVVLCPERTKLVRCRDDGPLVHPHGNRPQAQSGTERGGGADSYRCQRVRRAQQFQRRVRSSP